MRKNKIIVFFAFFIFIVFSVFAKDEYTISVPKKYQGTYIPAAFYEYFDATLDFEGGKYRPFEGFHDVLYIYNDTCRSDLKFHDSYAITTYDFSDFKFVENKSGLYVIDNNGFLYKRISKVVGPSEYYKYVFNKLFYCIKDLEYVQLSNTAVTINGDDYELVLDSLFLNGDDVDFWLSCGNDFYGVRLSGISAAVYETTRDKFDCVYISDKVKFEFPVFSYSPVTEFSKMNNEELRLYRNLQFAYHGYNFTSKNFKKIFSEFEWYKPNLNGKEPDLTEKEQKIVDQCLRYEDRL